MIKIRDITGYLEKFAPPSLQEEYDNAGLITGDHNSKVNGVLICLDSTEEVIDEAIQRECNLVIAHHPIVFAGLKKITGSNYVQKTIIKAIKNDIAIYALHTNLDNIKHGVNNKIADRLELINRKILKPKPSFLQKLITFIPEQNTKQVLDAIHDAGAGIIGDYDHCSFRVKGTGRYRPNEYANPHIGQKESIEEVNEDRIEVIFPTYLTDNVLDALKLAHPYEEVAYYLQSLNNESEEVGSGLLGELKKEMYSQDFLAYIKEKLNLHHFRYTPVAMDKIHRIAICGGAGSFLIQKALSVGASAYITSDIKYHEFFDGEGKMMITDIGHYESEVFTKELIFELLNKKFSNIAPQLSEVNTNPVRSTCKTSSHRFTAK
jgi:dinuclear metal center YbgI/SA1388 family protein